MWLCSRDMCLHSSAIFRKTCCDRKHRELHSVTPWWCSAETSFPHRFCGNASKEYFPFSQILSHTCHKISSFMVSLPIMSLADRFCMSRKGGTEGGRWVYPKGENSIAISGLGLGQNWVGRFSYFLPNDCIWRRETFSHFWQCPWDWGSAWAERVGQGEVDGCTWRVQTAWPCLSLPVERP